MLEAPPSKLKKNLSFEVQSVGIVDQEMKVLRNKVLQMVKVLWRNYKVEEMTLGDRSFNEEPISVLVLRLSKHKF